MAITQQHLGDLASSNIKPRKVSGNLLLSEGSRSERFESVSRALVVFRDSRPSSQKSSQHLLSPERWHRLRTGLSKCSDSWGFTPVMRVRSFAHDRVTLSVYHKPPRGLFLSPRVVEKAENGWQLGNLGLRHELQAGLKIGGRFRKMPLETKFTVHARNMVRDAGHILEHYDEGVAIFLTLTVAGGTDEVFKTFSVASPVITNRFNTWLRERVNNGNYVFVWELQSRGAPHLHYLFRVSRSVDLARLRSEIHREWRKILADLSAETGVDLFARADGSTWFHDKNKPRLNVRLVKHDYARYIAKYCSKTRTKGGAAAIFRPSRWWGVSNGLRAELKRLRIDEILPCPSLGDAFRLAQSVAACESLHPKGALWVIGGPTESMGILSFFALPKKAHIIASAVVAFIATGCLGSLKSLLEGSGRLSDSS